MVVRVTFPIASFFGSPQPCKRKHTQEFHSSAKQIEAHKALQFLLGPSHSEYLLDTANFSMRTELCARCDGFCCKNVASQEKVTEPQHHVFLGSDEAAGPHGYKSHADPGLQVKRWVT